MRVEHQIRAFEQIFKSYDGVLPLHRFLFTYFKQNRQMGSTDRRWATRYIYSFFRLGKALIKEQQLTRLAIADFLCNTSSSLIIEHQLPGLKDAISSELKFKLNLVKEAYKDFRLEDVFSFR